MKIDIFSNVWDAIEDSPEKSEEMTKRSDLMIQLSNYITGSKLTNSQAASLFGVSDVRIADLLRGDINTFELSLLIKMAAEANLSGEAATK